MEKIAYEERMRLIWGNDLESYLREMVAQRRKHLSHETIGKLFGITRGLVRRRLKMAVEFGYMSGIESRDISNEVQVLGTIRFNEAQPASYYKERRMMQIGRRC